MRRLSSSLSRVLRRRSTNADRRASTEAQLEVPPQPEDEQCFYDKSPSEEVANDEEEPNHELEALQMRRISVHMADVLKEKLLLDTRTGSSTL